MSKKMLIDATHAEETRVVVLDGNRVEEFDFETVNKRQLAGNIYLAKVTRVEPSLQAAFVDYGGNRHGFLAFAEIHPDYYQIPLADRRALLEEERALARAEDDEEQPRARPPRDDARTERAEDGARSERRGRGRGRSRGGDRPADAAAADAEMTDAEAIDAPAAEGDAADVGADAAAQADAASAVDLPAATAAPQSVDFAPEIDTASDGDAGPASMAHPVEGDEVLNGPDLPVAPQPAGMEVVDLNDEDRDADQAYGGTDAHHHAAAHSDDDRGAYRAIDHASDSDDEIESIADEDIAEEIAAPRRPRARRYKIQEVIKVRQIMLVQVVKEERGNKGAALTTYLSLAGRYCVLMPNTARGGGISRKIVQAADRKKLKEIAQEIEVPEGAGLIIRTAGAKRTKPEIKRDYEYLMRLWEQIRDLTLKSMAPAAIYEEGDLIKRTIRDLYSSEIEEILVEGEAGYRTAKDFMRMIMPAHAKQVVRYTDPTPLFARYGVESYLSGMFNPTVQLKSGGYIVIGITEALVAIDVNSGRATKEGSIEDTALKTNLEAAEEVARQLRLRDLAGLIVIDFIDMEERRNNIAVEKRLKDRLKTDRARIQVGRISGFGLLEMSRQRLRPGMLESTTQPCPHCHGTGLIRSDDSLGLQVLRALEEEGTRKRSREVLLRAPIGIVNFLINNKREHIALIEARTGMAVRIECDPALISPDFSIEKFKTATRMVADSAAISGNASLMGAPVAEDDQDDDLLTDIAGDEGEDDASAPTLAQAPKSEAKPDAKDKPKDAGEGDGGKKRRRRRRRKPRNGAGETNADAMALGGEEADEGEVEGDTQVDTADGDLAENAVAETATAPVKRTRAPRRGKKTDAPEAAPLAVSDETLATAASAPKPRRGRSKAADAADAAEEAAAKPARTPRKTKAKVAADQATDDSAAIVDAQSAPAVGQIADHLPPADTAEPVQQSAVIAEGSPAPAAPEVPEVPPTDAPPPEPPSDKPRKRGWWSGRG